MSSARSFAVEFAALAEADLIAIAGYVADERDAETARRLLDRLRDRATALERFPSRGAHPKELEGANRLGYRQLNEGPYRIVYRQDGERVIIVMIADGRRDMQALLRERLLRPEVNPAD